MEKEVKEAVDKQNKKILVEKCTTVTKEGSKIHSKSKTVHAKLISSDYKRQPLKELIQGTRQRTKTLILARHGMLECGTNRKGTIPEKCRNCDVVDDESHRLNDCKSYNSHKLSRKMHLFRCFLRSRIDP